MKVDGAVCFLIKAYMSLVSHLSLHAIFFSTRLFLFSVLVDLGIWKNEIIPEAFLKCFHTLV